MSYNYQDESQLKISILMLTNFLIYNVFLVFRKCKLGWHIQANLMCTKLTNNSILVITD